MKRYHSLSVKVIIDAMMIFNMAVINLVKAKLRCLAPKLLVMLLIVSLSGIPVDASPKAGDRGNIAPTIDLSVTPAKKPVDIVILTDYTGTKLAALNTQINTLKAQFSAVNVDPKFHIVSDIKKVGTQSDQLYNFKRYSRFITTYSGYSYYSDYSLQERISPYIVEEKMLWEETQGLMSQYAFLPLRNPKNVKFTKGNKIIDLGREDETDIRREYYNVTISCTNDVKSSWQCEQEIYYKNYARAKEAVYGGITSEKAVVDTTWTIGSKISDVMYDVYSLDFDKLSSIPLRAGSDRHLIFLSDAHIKDYGKTKGNYFSFGDMTETVRTYINNNNFSVYGVASEKTRHATLELDKVSKIEPNYLFTLFYMENGDLLKLGNATLAQQLISGDNVYPEIINGFTPYDVKEIVPQSTDRVYMLMNDGTAKVGTRNGQDFETISVLSDVKDIMINGSYGLYVLSNSGKVYNYDYRDNTLSLYQVYNVVIDRMLEGGIFLTAEGTPYGIMGYWDGTWVYNQLARVRKATQYYDDNAREWRYNYSNMGNIKDFQEYHIDTWRNGAIAQYTNNSVQKFDYISSMTEENKAGTRKWTYVSFFIEEDYPFSESNVSSISSTYRGVILHKTNGTTRMITNNDTTSQQISLNNITPIYCNYYDKNFYKDANNRLYMITSSVTAPAPDDSAIADLGVIGGDIQKIAEYRGKFYILYNNGTLKAFGYVGKPTYAVMASILYTDVKDIYWNDWQMYILKNDGSVLGTGYSDNGQLGVAYNANLTFANTFHSSLTFDKTKTYYSLLDMFNEITDNKFYPAGAYAAAFTDIYNKYSSNSSGNMYVVLGDDIKYDSAYDDYEKDPEHSRKWTIAHEPYYFDNSMGRSVYHNPAGFATSPPVKLDKVGKYTINLYARDNPKADNRWDGYRLWSLGNHNLTVYIHRKPIALMRIAITNNGNGTYTVVASDAGSYDLDHSNSRADKGITAREWRWRESTSTIWTTGQMNKADCSPEKAYIIQLRVKDVEGVWSDYTTINIDRNNPPAALFSLDSTVIKSTDLLKVKDQSFPQSFSTLTNWHWVVKKLNTDGTVPAANLQSTIFTNSNVGTGTLAGYDSNVKTGYSANGAGTFRAYLRVKDSNGLWSDGAMNSTTPVDLSKYYSMDFVVDKPPTPSFTVANNVIKTTDLLKVTDTTTSTGVSGIARWHWIVKKLNSDSTVPSTNLQSAIFNNSNEGTGAMAGYDENVKTDYSSNGAGVYRIYLRACNGNGMWSDGGTDSSFTLSSFFSRDIVVDAAPTAGFEIEKNPIEPTEILRLRDTSIKNGISEIDRWHWIVKKLDGTGGAPGTILQDQQHTASNKGTGALAGCDSNVVTDYSAYGPGTYRIYLRVRNANGMWSEGGTDTNYNLEGFFQRELKVQESFKISNFRVVKVKDLHLEGFYYNTSTGQYDDRPMDVNVMAIDRHNFGGMVQGLAKGYSFQFEIDSVNFNGISDEIVIIPHFYTCDSSGRDTGERELYWENSNHEILKAGEGGHAAWAEIRLGRESRTILDENRATWRGSYLIPGTAWAVPKGTTAKDAVVKRLRKDIIVGFEIKGYKEGELKFDYNLRQWPSERTHRKGYYEIGDVIRYDHTKCNLDDNRVILNRP